MGLKKDYHEALKEVNELKKDFMDVNKEKSLLLGDI